MNHVTLIGNLTKDIDLRSTINGTHVARFNIAVRRDDKTTDFPTCVAWGKTADLLEKYCRKGSKIGIEGRVETSMYQKDGKNVYKTEINVSSIEFLNSKSNNSQNQETANMGVEMDDIETPLIDDNDLPF